jgi:hypothetical protein
MEQEPLETFFGEQSSQWASGPVFLSPVPLAHLGLLQQIPDRTPQFLSLDSGHASSALPGKGQLAAFTLNKKSHFSDALPSIPLNVATRRTEISWHTQCNKY